MERREALKADVCVVGAGISGLVSARAVREAGLSVCVLEARSHAGGRLESVTDGDGTAYDAGGQFLGKTQTLVYELAADLGLSPALLPDDPRFVTVRKGVRLTSGEHAPADPDAHAQHDLALDRILAMAHELDAAAPWTHPRADEWDSMTFHTWAEANIPSGAARLSVGSELMPAAPFTDVSVLRVLEFVRSIGDRDDVTSTEHGVISGGTFQLPQRLAERLGDAVVCSTPVRTIERLTGGVRVISDRVTVEADVVIVAIAPQLVERIDFTPDLPPRRRILQQRWVQKPSVKSIAVYDTPWWRERGYSGRASTDLPVAPFINDASDPADGRGVLVSFTGLSRRLPSWAIDDDRRRRREFLNSIEIAFGPSAPAPRVYLEGNWFGRRWSGGAGNLISPGVLSQYGDMLRAPVGPIVWAGTEVADRWPTFIEGAIRAGNQAADDAKALVGRSASESSSR